jgi:hypothetical protein
MMLGFTPKEQGNLTACAMGLTFSKNGWTKVELKRMLYLQDLDKRIEH